MTRIIHAFVILMAALFLIPCGAVAQDDFPRFEPEYSRDGPRGAIQVTNDWRDEVRVTMWTPRRERIGDSWVLEPGESAFLAVDEDRIRVRPSYKIKVGSDWGWVDVGSVGQFRRGVWYVNVRDIWRATHQRGGGRYDRYERYDNIPDREDRHGWDERRRYEERRRHGDDSQRGDIQPMLPVQPTRPTRPAQPQPMEPPTRRAQPQPQPMEPPTRPVQPQPQPMEPPIRRAQPQPMQPPIRPAQPGQPVQPQPAQPGQPVQPQPAQPGQPDQLIWPAQPGQPMRPM